MDEMTEFQAILQEYGEDVKKLEKVKRPMDGLFGLGKSPAMDSCHERMDQRLEALVKRACGLVEGEAGADPRTADAAPCSGRTGKQNCPSTPIWP